MLFPTSCLSRYRFGAGSAPTPPPTPPVVVVTTQTFQGFGGGFLGPHYKRKREEIYAKAQLFGPPPVYRFNRRDLLPILRFADPVSQDPLLAMAAKAESAIKPAFTIKGLSRVKISGLNEYYRDEKKRKTKKRQREEDELLLLL